MGSVSDAYDNALAELQNGAYKSELIRPTGSGAMSNKSRSWVNHERTHASVDDLTPIEVEEADHAARNRLIPTG